MFMKGLEKIRSLLDKYKLSDKLKALELIGRHLGMFKDKIELSGGLDTEKTKLDDLLQQMRGGDEQ